MMKRGWEKIRLIVMLSPQKLALLVFIIASVISLLFQITTALLSPSYQEPSSCITMKATILADIARQDTCKQDADCLPLNAHCPFSCMAVHQEAVTAVTAKIQAYTSECGLCLSNTCSATVLSQARCIDQHCIIVPSP